MRKNHPRIHDGENYKGNVLIKIMLQDQVWY